MRLPWQRDDPDRDADGADARTPPSDVPSAEATDRLAGRLRREIDELHAELADDLLLTMLLLGEDEADGAVGMLEDSSDRLHRFQDRLEGVIAEAAVEREAEAVLAGAATGAGRDAPGRSVSGAFRIRALASAAAAILAAVVGLVSLEPTAGPDLLTAGSRSAPAAADPPSTGPSLASGTAASRSSGPSTDASGASTPRQRLQALIGQRSELLVRLGSEPRRSAVAELFGVDRLVAQLASEDAAVPELAPSAVASLSPTELPIGPSEDPAAEDGQQPEPQPTTEAAPRDEPSDDLSPSPSDTGTESESPSDDTSDEAPSAPGVPDDANGDDGSSSDTAVSGQLLP